MSSAEPSLAFDGLRVEDLVVEFDTDDGILRAVDGVNFSVEAGKTLGIVGESGCGKTVSCLSIMGLVPQPHGRVSSGHIWYQGKDILGFDEDQLREMRGNEISMIFQDPMTSLNPVYTVGNQIMEAIELHQPELNKDQVLDRCIELLELVGIPAPVERVKNYPHELSGGMRQRVMIAMALSCGPRVLIADEPTTALDVTIQAQILDLLRELQKKENLAIILITHDLGVVAEMADDVLVMYAGVVAEQAPVEEIFAKTHHPYTHGLLASIPKLGQERIQAIPGLVPSLTNRPAGCRFSDRCQYVKDLCRASEPSLVSRSDTHQVRCILEEAPR